MSIKAIKRTVSQNIAHELKDPLIKSWILKILVPLNGYLRFLSSDYFSNDELAHALGLGHWLDDSITEYDQKKVLQELKSLAQKAGSLPVRKHLPEILNNNINKLANMIGLSDTDCDILSFAVMLNNFDKLNKAADLLGQVSTVELYDILSIILDIPKPKIREALSLQGILAQTGLLVVSRTFVFSVTNKFEFISQSFSDILFSAELDPVAMLRDVMVPSPLPDLSWQDYSHIADSVDMLRVYAEKAIPIKKKGLNIFIHGSPGTGKTQLTRLLAAHLNLQAYEITTTDDDGDYIIVEGRLRALRAAQSLLANQPALLVFDEAEEVLNDITDLFDRSRAKSRKAWMNKALEENKVPVIWVSNSAEGIDPAIVRRFDLIIELPIPARSHRYEILEKICDKVLTPAEISIFANCEELSPAVAGKAISVTKLIQKSFSRHEPGKIARTLVNNTLKAQGYNKLEYSRTTPLPQLYDPTLINCDHELVELAKGIKRAGSARLCLFGPPGTGKTAYAQWLAQQLDKPLILKRASDLISMYIGQTEKKIASAFNQATDQGAVLLIDEVDSFLQDRRNARASWDVTMVNEMLTQLESFDGIFIASTNLMDNLDQAVLRRFDIRLKFDFLEPEQSTELARRYCQQLNLGKLSTEDVTSLQLITTLTPGDFATLERRHHFSAFKSVREFVDALWKECTVKKAPILKAAAIH